LACVRKCASRVVSNASSAMPVKNEEVQLPISKKPSGKAK